MIPVRAFYEWADALGLVSNDIVTRMTEIKYFAAGTPGGGEYGRSRRVMAEGLRPNRQSVAPDPEWINDNGARAMLETIELPPRDRLLIDLMYLTGIRVGEALSLFTQDIHFAGGPPGSGCSLVNPHFHVRVDNVTENGARSKGGPRVLYADYELVETYIDYVLKRQESLGVVDSSAHLFVNILTRGPARGRAMSYDGARNLTLKVGERIGFPLTGPHMFRHTFATRLIRGIDCEQQPIDVVQLLLGHASIESTRVYTHDQEQVKLSALASLRTRTVNLRTGI